MGKYDSFFVSDTIHEKEVTLADGKKHTLYFRELDTVAFRKFQIAERSDDENERAQSVAKLIVASLCEPDGKPAMSFEKAKRLKPSVSNAILSAIFALNSPGDDAGKG
jgi:hypothetical protein